MRYLVVSQRVAWRVALVWVFSLDKPFDVLELSNYRFSSRVRLLTHIGESPINILLASVSGEPFPKFLLDHVREQWSGVAISPLDPDICLKVDTALTYAGCPDPSLSVRQFLYVYHESVDFDYEILPLLVELLSLAGDDESVWNALLTLDLQRDCGLSREEYAAELMAMIDELTVVAVLEPDLPPAQLSA